VLAPIKCGLQLHWFHAGESNVGPQLFQLFSVMERNPAREDGCKHAILLKNELKCDSYCLVNAKKTEHQGCGDYYLSDLYLFTLVKGITRPD